MKLLDDRIQIREVGFPPSAATRTGLSTTWSFAVMLREHSKLRIGIVEHIGVKCIEAKPDMYVLYSTLNARPLDIAGKGRYMVREDNIMGEYQGIKITEKGLQMTEIKFTPFGDRVVIEREAEKPPVPGKLVIPDTAKEKPNKGTVVKAGPGLPGITPTAKVGDKVLFGRSSGLEIELEEGKFLLMREGDIYGIL